ncbi:MAG: sugar ABC transporter substrate-binding protein [Limnochordales bacterium]|nr:sugar ABC transporter substrate-binding protein [Limnochordales bacterium]
MSISRSGCRFGRDFVVFLVSIGLLLTGAAVLPTSDGVSVKAADVVIHHYTYSGHGAEWQQYLTAMAKRFEAETGIKVNITVSGNFDEWRSKFTTMVAGGVGPDVTDAHPALAGPFIGQGYFEDLRPYIQRDRVPINEMPPAAVHGCTTPEGVIWGIPVSIYPMVTFFNADIFAELGLLNPRELGENWNWDTFTQSVRRITSDLNGDGKTDRYGTYRLDWRWEMHVHQAGGKIWDRFNFPTKSYFNTPEVLKAVKWLYQLMVVDKVESFSSSYSVWNGKAGLTLAYGPGVIKTYLSDVKFKWGIALQPKGAVSRAARVNPDGFQIVATSKNKEAAWRWVRYLVADVNRQLELTRFTARMPSLREAMLQYPKAMPNLPDNWMVFFQTAFDPASYSPYLIADAKLDSLVNSTMARLWRGELIPEEALTQIHEQATKLLQQQR